jgi:hypothetical protein
LVESIWGITIHEITVPHVFIINSSYLMFKIEAELKWRGGFSLLFLVLLYFVILVSLVKYFLFGYNRRSILIAILASGLTPDNFRVGCCHSMG